MEQTEVEAYNYQTKKQNSKTQSTTSIDQLKFNKKEDFYKAKFFKNSLNSGDLFWDSSSLHFQSLE